MDQRWMMASFVALALLGCGANVVFDPEAEPGEGGTASTGSEVVSGGSRGMGGGMPDGPPQNCEEYCEALAAKGCTPCNCEPSDFMRFCEEEFGAMAQCVLDAIESESNCFEPKGQCYWLGVAYRQCEERHGG